MSEYNNPKSLVKSKVLRTKILDWLSGTLGPFLGLLGVIVLFGMLSDTFLTAYTWRTIAVQTVIVGTAALGMTLIMIAGGIDLSVGSTVALVAVMSAALIRDQHWPLPLALAGGVMLGVLCGTVNGALVVSLRLAPFIVTLGTMNIYRGIAMWQAGRVSVYAYDSVLNPDVLKPRWLGRFLSPNNAAPSWMSGWGGPLGDALRFVGQLAPGVWLLAGMAVATALVLRYSVLGRHLYALGSSESTARLCGIPVPRTKLWVYALGGLMTGIAGVMQFANNSAAGDPVGAKGMELEVIAAVVIGGGSLNGGEGGVLGTLIGCLIIVVLRNGCTHAGIPTEIQDIVIGVIIVAAVTLDQLRARRLAGSRGSAAEG